VLDSDDDDDFEGGDNQVRKKDEFDIEDEEKFKDIVELDNLRNSDIEAENDSLSLQAKTNYFVSSNSCLLKNRLSTQF
jgi:hypothetical protein